MLEWLVQMLGGHSLHIGYGFVFAMLVLCGFGLPLPEDVILVTGGVLAWLEASRQLGLDTASVSLMLGDPGLLAMMFVGLVGIVTGDSVIFFAGRKFGVRVADFRPLRRVITPEKLEKVEKLMRRRGNVVVVIARYLPGIRAPTYFTAGHARLPYWEFLVFDAAAALVSAPLWVCIGFYFGSNIEDAARFAARFGHYILLGVSVVLLGIGLRWLQTRRAAASAAEAAAQGERE
ncbi:DedA family protein [Anaeromyxobacter oryzisoli]|uniref:DedA family protein n=1 Tax=Anaeromyxobacter oryzisoli TaxID=2925408 RepID=UPI001F580E52|nr:DedA family protein [Anaeromyxobacter sp. SG63]